MYLHLTHGANILQHNLALKSTLMFSYLGLALCHIFTFWSPQCMLNFTFFFFHSEMLSFAVSTMHMIT